MGSCICKVQTLEHVQQQTKETEQLIETVLKQSMHKEELQQETRFKTKTQTMKISPEILVRKQCIQEKFSSHYEIIKKLGQGGFGEVFLVKHIQTQQFRAAKMVLRKSISCEEKLLEETEILKTLDHPNIVKVLEIFADFKYYYIVTEYCEGGELLQRVRTLTYYNERLTAEYMKQIFSAIIYCHSNCVVHRDLKPENILFDSRDPKANLKIIDFGASEKMINEKLTKKVGTPYYVAPEVIKSTSYDEKVDVWSCGVILYILLCGRPPFKGLNDIETLKLARIGKFDLQSEKWTKISSDAKDLIAKMIIVDPTKRITAEEAYNHQWISNNNEQNLFNDSGMIKYLTSFHAQNKLKAAILQFISVQLVAKDESKTLFETFKALDINGDGVLSKEELLQGIMNCNIEVIKAEFMVNEIMEQVDVNESGKVDFTEFISAVLVQQQKITVQNIRNAFKMFDIDENGQISKHEFEEVFGGIEIDFTIWEDMLLKFDNNQNGAIEEDEFINLLQNLEF